ncbi:MAG TPA: phosphate signaling complex protein PhoU [Halanaerobiales bacterium]|nr:phosphate signaling complex protein PhoU [Halanaerobiales bacterium]
MRKGFHEQLKDLENDMIKMGSMVEEAIHKSIKALQEKDLELAQEVLDEDDKIDDFEIKLEEETTRLIALQQPVAKDLREIIVISKLATDLERIGDHAWNIANMVLKIGDEPLIKPLIDIPRMTNIVTRRLRESLDAFINLDVEKAKEIAKEDDEVDVLDEQILRELLTFMIEDPSKIEQATSLIFVSRFLERIGDHSTNVCERVIYMKTGERDFNY